MGNYSFSEGVKSNHAGYVHTTAASVISGLLNSSLADDLSTEELSELAYEIACDYVRKTGQVKSQGIPGMPDQKLALVFKHALFFLEGSTALLNHKDRIHGIAQRAIDDAVTFVTVGDRFNADINHAQTPHSGHSESAYRY